MPVRTIMHMRTGKIEGAMNQSVVNNMRALLIVNTTDRCVRLMNVRSIARG